MSSDFNRSHLYTAVCTVNLAAFALGVCMTWPSPSLPKLQDKATSFLWINNEQASWIASLLSLGTVFGPFVGGYLTSRIGRKWTVNVAVVIILISCITLLAAQWSLMVEQIYIARFITGISAGIIYAILPMYVAEVSDDSSRATLGTFFAFFLSPGYLLTYILGPFISFSALLLVSMIPCVIYFIAVAFVPETPYYLVQKGQFEGALESLTWLRHGKSISEVKNELNSIKESVEESMSQSGTLKDLLSTRGNRMGLFISSSLASLQQFSGINVVLFYSETIFNLSGSTFSSSICTIAIGFILLVASGIAPPFTRAFGVRTCLLVSAIGMALFQGTLGVYFLLHHQGYDLSKYSWAPILCLVCYITVFALGFGPCPWIVMGEVFPSNVKPIGSAITASFCYIASFILSKIFPLMDAYVSFFIFTAFCLIGLFFTFFLVPDTRGMSFQDIQNLLNKRNVVR